MGWVCLRVRKQLPLWVGEDLLGCDESFVNAHLKTCNRCGKHARALQAAREALLYCRDDLMPSTSLWPELRNRLTPPSPLPARHSWLPIQLLTAAVSVLVGLILWYGSYRSDNTMRMNTTIPVAAEPQPSETPRIVAFELLPTINPRKNDPFENHLLSPLRIQPSGQSNYNLPTTQPVNYSGDF